MLTVTKIAHYHLLSLKYDASVSGPELHTGSTVNVLAGAFHFFSFSLVLYFVSKLSQLKSKQSNWEMNTIVSKKSKFF